MHRVDGVFMHRPSSDLWVKEIGLMNAWFGLRLLLGNNSMDHHSGFRRAAFAGV